MRIFCKDGVWGELYMRENLKKARKNAGMTQKEVAGYLGISERYYRSIELGERKGDFEIWDSIEDLFGIHQRILRKLSSN
ncbi:XRE family transcriptional regulator [bacterium D16-36]|nr:XRE family transcriptional regulator [bacterium D16-36]